MEFDSPIRLADGRYFAKLQGDAQYVSVPNVLFGERTPEAELGITDAGKVLAYTRPCIEAAVTNSKQWFNKVISEDVVESYFQSGYDEKTHTLEVEDADAVVCFSASKDIIETIAPGTVCTVLLKFDGLWFLRKTFGPVWRLVQARVKPIPEPVKCLIQDDE